MDIKISKLARNYLDSLRESDKNLLTEKIKQYANDSNSLTNNVKKLQGRDGYRLRVGQYRIIFDKEGNLLHIIKIGLRGFIYG